VDNADIKKLIELNNDPDFVIFFMGYDESISEIRDIWKRINTGDSDDSFAVHTADLKGKSNIHLENTDYNEIVVFKKMEKWR